MPPKRKSLTPHEAGCADISQSVTPANAKKPRARRVVEQRSEHESTAGSQVGPRRSSRAGKGSGGQIQQLHNIEQIQTATHTRPAARSLEIAVQGHSINPMAPSYLSEDEPEPESQIPPWWDDCNAIAADRQLQDSLSDQAIVRPSFTLSAPGHEFGFKLPDSTTQSVKVPSTHPVRALPSSTMSVALSSRNSVFSGSMSRGGSTAPTSQAPSECDGTDTTSQEGFGWRSSQLRRLAAAAGNSEAIPRASRVKPSAPHSSTAPSLQSQHSAPTRDSSLPPPPRTLGSRRPQPSRQLPQPLPEEEPVIDEASPSEDERFAQSVIRGDYQGSTGVASRHASVPVIAQRDAEDVVAQHRQRNRTPRLPDNMQLLAVRKQQTSQSSQSLPPARDEDGHENSAVNGLDFTDETPFVPSADDTPHPYPVSCQQQVNTGTPGILADNADPSQLHSYPPAVRDVIERAKQFSHCDIASINSFPFRQDFNETAVEYINEAIAERHSRGLSVPDGWWPRYTSDITKLLWEDLGNWRSALKKKARTYVRERYEWDPQNRRSINTDIAKTLLDRGAFLKNGTDEQGHTNNFAHPALSGLILDFFYTGSNAVGNLFPEVFGDEVPRPAVALAATAIKVALDEMLAEGKDVAFRRDVYSDVYADILGLMAKCDTSDVHRRKTKSLRIQWAKLGRNGTSSGVTGFDVDLD